MSDSTFVCHWCYRKFNAKYMGSPHQCMICWNNPFRTRELK